MLRIPNPVILAFNPRGKESSKVIKEIFENNLARTVWIGYKSCHLTDQYFNEACLELSKFFKAKGLPESPSHLQQIVGDIIQGFHTTPPSLEFAIELFDYLSGEKELKYEIRVSA